ncbi:unnamed protein product [Colias eurytheme]|nr:unnamed protein product [Colias eurytheme]
MLSPLFVNMAMGSTPVENQPSMFSCAISPEMIYESIRKLSMWKQCVETETIMEYIMRNYPVNPDKDALLLELLEKLRIAAIVGFICQMSNNSWSLACALQNRKLSKNHVTLFWKLYSDTMKPISKEQANQGNETVNNQTQVLRFCDRDIL